MTVGSETLHPDPVPAIGKQELALGTGLTSLAVFLAYDRPDTARSALAFLDQIGTRLGREVGLDVRVWRMDLVEDAECAWQARADATATDLMMVAFGSRPVLPAGFARWLEEWARHGEVEEAALAVWTHRGTAPDTLKPPVQALQAIAERHNLTFVAGSELPARASPLRQESSVRDVPLGEWGINE